MKRFRDEADEVFWYILCIIAFVLLMSWMTEVNAEHEPYENDPDPFGLHTEERLMSPPFSMTIHTQDIDIRATQKTNIVLSYAYTDDGETWWSVTDSFWGMPAGEVTVYLGPWTRKVVNMKVEVFGEQTCK